MDTPVALLIYNRPELTKLVLQRLGQVAPKRLLVIADGPTNETDSVRCAEARRLIDDIDWPCELERNFAQKNLGCRARVSSGLDWLFDRCDRAIVIEDDCLPEPTFFRFASELLDRYADDERVGQISGDNFQFGQRKFESSYYLSYMCHIWGWASWRRAWRHYDVTAGHWGVLHTTDWLERHLQHPALAAQFRRSLDRVYRNELDTWDVQWAFALWRANALTALPAVNLVQNVGFGAGATHTTSARSVCANLATEPMTFPLIHPAHVSRDAEADELSLRRLVETRNL